MTKHESTIPFCGFYESMASSIIDDEIRSIFDHEGTGDSDCIPESFWMEYNGRDIAVAFCRLYVELYQDWLKSEYGIEIKLDFKEMTSPRQYNFSTDRIFVELSSEDLLALHGGVDESALRDTIKDIFTSRDGFISFYDNSLDEWPENIEEWDSNQIGTLFEALGEPVLWELMEDSQGNGEITNIIFDNLPEECLAIIKQFDADREASNV